MSILVRDEVMDLAFMCYQQEVLGTFENCGPDLTSEQKVKIRRDAFRTAYAPAMSLELDLRFIADLLRQATEMGCEDPMVAEAWGLAQKYCEAGYRREELPTNDTNKRREEF